MSSDDLENYEAERELQLAWEYQDVASAWSEPPSRPSAASTSQTTSP
ncbi:MAG: hypothetical protein R2713_00760 [Ilumatobacteraceae bacterium]